MKKLVVPLTGRPLDRRAVAAAFLVAERFGAHVEGLCVMPHVEIRQSIEGAAIPSSLMEQLVKIGKQEQAEIMDGAHKLFDEFRGKHGASETPEAGRPDGASASWQQCNGSLAETVAEEARLADLAVIAQASDGSNAMSPTIEAALFHSGRPLLLAPSVEPASLGDRVAVAWDGGGAASRAVAAAMPFLERAARVVILTAGTPSDGRSADPARLAAYLATHGIEAELHPFTPTGRSISKALLDEGEKVGCDLLVMGAYGHSRVREMVWGGVTLDVLRTPQSLPILMAH